MEWVYNRKQYTLHITGCCHYQGNPKYDSNWIVLKSENDALEMDGVAVHKCKVCQKNLEKILRR